MVFKGSIKEIILQIRTVVDTYPRRLPGSVICDGVTLEYVDLHSFYYQAFQIFEKGLYHFDTKNHSPRIIDCGAHIGLATLFFHINYPNSRVTSFEADPKIFTILQNNLTALGLEQEIASQKAVWITNDDINFNMTSDDSGFVSEEGVTVPSVRLHDILETEERVDLLKMDIEGAEFNVISDCSDMLHKVDRLIVEAHVLSDSIKCPSLLGQMLATLENIGMQYVLGDFHSATWIEGGKVPPFKFITTDRYICTVFAWWN
ncbi:FkbM family methyltransferase [Kiloniella antarctica]|uniref:FkbM family methyltransferase n=1 Tax=Kiloniella antarctica TaxID=1550907 RepID=A0ABW5BP49_9PROT